MTTRAWSVPLGALVHEHCNGPVPDVFHNGREEIRQPDADRRESGDQPTDFLFETGRLHPLSPNQTPLRHGVTM